MLHRSTYTWLGAILWEILHKLQQYFIRRASRVAKLTADKLIQPGQRTELIVTVAGEVCYYDGRGFRVF
jgi:hypothetical protein